MTVSEVLASIARHPYESLVRRWNWKSALTSALIRGGVFFTANLSAGLGPAVGAMLAEFAYRTLLSGLYGSVLEKLRAAEPAWKATLAAMLLLPACSHAVEFGVHWTRGTPKLAVSIAASVSFTILSTLFNLYAMRRGVLLIGSQRQSFAADMAVMPRIIAGFVAAGPLHLWRIARRIR